MQSVRGLVPDYDENWPACVSCLPDVEQVLGKQMLDWLCAVLDRKSTPRSREDIANYVGKAKSRVIIRKVLNARRIFLPQSSNDEIEVSLVALASAQWASLKLLRIIPRKIQDDVRRKMLTAASALASKKVQPIREHRLSKLAPLMCDEKISSVFNDAKVFTINGMSMIYLLRDEYPAKLDIVWTMPDE